MADEYSKPPYYRKINIHPELNWESLQNKSGAELETQYIKILNKLGKEKGMIGEILLNVTILKIGLNGEKQKDLKSLRMMKLFQGIKQTWIFFGLKIIIYRIWKIYLNLILWQKI